MAKKPVIFFLGKSGSGKDTQADILIEKYGFDSISTGDLLREFKNSAEMFAEGSIERYEAEKIKSILAEGKFLPTLSVVCQWRFAALEVVKNFESTKGLVFKGSPRKLAEAMILDDFFKHWPGAKEYFAVRPVKIELSDDEAMKRLLVREREDDSENAIRKRLSEFKEFVVPVIDYFKKEKRLLSINGEQSVDDVHLDVVKALDPWL